MESIREEIKDELKRTRLDKTRLYQLILKLVDTITDGTEDMIGRGSQGPTGRAGPEGRPGPEGPPGPQGPPGECKCKCTKEEAAPVVAETPKKTTTTPVATETPKKTTTATKKKTTTKKATTA